VSLPKETVVSLHAFRKRNDEARRVLAELKQQRTDVDFDHYRKALKNQSIIDDAQKALNGFKPATYNLDAQLQAINQFEAKAVSSIMSTLYFFVPTSTIFNDMLPPSPRRSQREYIVLM
jgi:F-type H+-transporting ATPase subunit d